MAPHKWRQNFELENVVLFNNKNYNATFGIQTELQFTHYISVFHIIVPNIECYLTLPTPTPPVFCFTKLRNAKLLLLPRPVGGADTYYLIYKLTLVVIFKSQYYSMY